MMLEVESRGDRLDRRQGEDVKNVGRWSKTEGPSKH